MTPPVGANLSFVQLVDALTWKLKRLTDDEQLSLKDTDAMKDRLLIILALLRGHRNSLQPIHQLPPEVLSIVFDYARPVFSSFIPLFNAPTSRCSLHAGRAWMSLLHVCRLWRGIIARSPRLWSTIDTAIIPLKYLKRSGTSPLTVCIEDQSTESLIKALAHHSSRFIHFHAFPHYHRGTTPFYQLLKYPAPLLTSLTFAEYAGSDTGSLPAIFNGVMPNLRELCLRHYTSWPSGYFTRLTKICLYDQALFSRPNLLEFLAFLSSSPKLEVLALVRAGPVISTSPEENFDTTTFHVTLGSLRHLEIGDWDGTLAVSLLLSHLTIPPDARLWLWSDHASGQYEDLGDLIPIDPSWTKNFSTVRKWELMRAGMSRDVPCAFFAIQDSVLQVAGLWSDQSIEHFASRSPLSHIREFIINDDLPPSASNSGAVRFWRKVFQHLPGLRHLDIRASESSMARILRGIEPIVDDHDNIAHKFMAKLHRKPPKDILLPSLRYLYIRTHALFPNLNLAVFSRKRAKSKCRLKLLELHLGDDSGALSPRSATPPPRINSPHGGYQGVSPNVIVPQLSSLRSSSSLSTRSSNEKELDNLVCSDIEILRKYVDDVAFFRISDEELPPLLPQVYSSAVMTWTAPQYLPESASSSVCRDCRAH